MNSSMSAPAPMQEETESPEDSFNRDQKAKMEKARRDEAFQKLKDGSQQLYKATGYRRKCLYFLIRSPHFCDHYPLGRSSAR